MNPAEAFRSIFRAKRPATRPSACAEPRSSVLPPARDVRLGGYRLGRVLGSGAFATVYEARRAKETVGAIKILRPELNEKRRVVQRFQRETVLLRCLRSPYVVRALDAGFDGEHYYLVTELLLGDTAARLIDRGRLSLQASLRVALDAAEGIRAVHRLGVVHRDVKPANLMVSPSGRATLIDLGLGRSAEETALTASGSVLGTAPYLPPEVILGREPHGQSADVYALGVTLYELLSCELPYSGSSVGDVISRIAAHEEPRRLAQRSPDLPRAVTGFVDELIARDPRRRLQDLDEICYLLERLRRQLGRNRRQRRKRRRPPQRRPLVAASETWEL